MTEATIAATTPDDLGDNYFAATTVADPTATTPVRT